MTLELRYFGTFRVLAGEVEVNIPSAPSARLIALLGTQPGRVWSRKEVADALWPGEPFSVTGNRLRTALVELRRALPDDDCLVSTKLTLALAASAVSSDLDRANDLRLNLRMAAEPEEQLRLYESLLQLIQFGALASWVVPWALEIRERWSATRHESLIMASRLALEVGQRARAVDHAQAAIGLDDRNPDAWDLYLRASAELGHSAVAARKFASVKRRADKEGWGFSPHLISLAKSVRDGMVGFGASPLEPKPGALALLGKAFQRMLEQEPDVAAHFLQSNSFTVEMSKNPGEILPLLERFRESVPEDTPAHIHATRALLYGHYVLNHHEEVLRLGDGLVERLSNPSHVYAAANAIAFCHFQKSDWDSAHRVVNLAEQAGIELNDPFLIHSARSQRASFLWHQGHIEAACTIYQEAYEVIKPISEQRPLAQLHIIEYNLGMALIHLGGREATAAEWSEKGLAGALALGHAAMYGFVKPACAYLRFIRGDSAATELMMEGLVEGHRSTNVRGFEIAMDLSAGCLSHIGRHAEALAIFKLIGAHRDGRQCPRTPAENLFVNRIITQCTGATPSRKWLGYRQRSQLIKAVGECLLGTG